MSRPLRIEFPGAFYHVTSRGNARQKIHSDDQDRAQFLVTLARVVDRYAWRCHAYCLMPNHYHLLIETPKPTLSLGMRQLNGLYTQVYNRRHGRVGHLFQGRFKAILVEKDAYGLELCRYIVLNPVRAKLVRHPGQWRWDSYRATAGRGQLPAYLTVAWILDQFGSRLKQAQERYRRFVAEGQGATSPWEELEGQIYLGNDAFIRKHQPGRVIREVPRRQTQAHRPALAALFQGARDRDRRILLAYRRYGYRLAEIAAYLGVHYATVSRHLARSERQHV